MLIKTSRSKFVASASLILFLLLIVNNSYLNGISTQESEAKLFFKEGVELFKDGDYFKALENFSKVLTLTKDKSLQTDTYFYLSLVNYYIGEKASSIEWIKRVIENDPDKEVSSLHPPEYIELFRKTKEEFASKPKPKPVEEKKVEERKPEPRTVAVKNGKKKGGGGKVLLILAGLVVVGGVAALLLLKKKEPTEGSIQVNSTPQGADVYLDGSNTGRTTNTTLTNVSVGTHTVKLLKDGYGDHEGTVTVIGDQSAIVDVTLNAHTISITQPTGGTSWIQGQEVQIKWTTGGGLAQFGSFRTNQAVNQAIQTARLNRQRINPSNSALRHSNTNRSGSNQERYVRSQFRSRRFAKIQGRSKSEGVKGGSSDLRNPRNSDLNRMNRSLSSPRKITPLGDVNVQTLSNIKIELYQGNSLREVIVPSASNTGNYDWTITPSLSDASNYKVRVSCSTDEDVYGESAAFAISANVGTIKVTSNPANAAIWLDGNNTGRTTPATLNDVPAGSHTIRLVLERYQDWETTVTVTRNITTTVPATLQVGNFTEDFDDGVADYFVERHPAAWHVESNVYKFNGDGSNEQSTSNYDLGNFSDFTFTAKGNRETYNSRWGISFRGTIPFRKYYLIYIEPWGTGRWSMWFYDNGAWTTEKSWTTNSAINTGANQWNKVKVVAKGEDFSIYINDVFMDTVTISGVRSTGRVGLTTWHGYNFVKFDDVSLSLSTTGAVKGGKAKISFSKQSGDPNKTGLKKQNTNRN